MAAMLFCVWETALPDGLTTHIRDRLGVGGTLSWSTTRIAKHLCLESESLS